MQCFSLSVNDSLDYQRHSIVVTNTVFCTLVSLSDVVLKEHSLNIHPGKLDS